MDHLRWKTAKARTKKGASIEDDLEEAFVRVINLAGPLGDAKRDLRETSNWAERAKKNLADLEKEQAEIVDALKDIHARVKRGG